MSYPALIGFLVAMLMAGCAVSEETFTEIPPGKWPAASSPAGLGRKAAAYVLGHPMGNGYSHSCAFYGVLIFSEATGDRALRDRVVDAYEPYLSGRKQPATGHVDHNLFGIIPYEIFRQTGSRAHLAQGKFLADEEWENPRSDGLTRYTRWWMDDMYMVPCLQAQAYKSLGDPAYADRGVNFLLAYCDRLQQENGLFHHTPDYPYFWVRGNGWAVAGMTEMLLALPRDHPKRPKLMSAYRKAMDGLIQCQEESGMWPQLLDYPRVRPESSGTGMYIFALATGVEQGWLPPEPYRNAAERAWLALTGYVDDDGRVSEVSHGTCSSQLKKYLCTERYPVGDFHGQAALLWAATALIRLESGG
jgi:rhamnogalacturonyl hydrolase YesR